MTRREFITGVGASAITWPVVARAQERVRRIGVLMPLAADDPHGQARLKAFQQRLQQLGWTDGRNLRFEIRWSAGNASDTRKYAVELVALAPDVILATGSNTMAPLLQLTSTVPIVFTLTPDPVGAGYVNTLSKPGGNATGFTMFEFGFGAKWLELLKEVSPGLKRVAVLRDPTISAGLGLFGAIQSAAPSVGVEPSPLNVRDAMEIERGVAEFGRQPNSGLIVTGSALTFVHRNLIASLAMQHKMPAIYWDRTSVITGGLISYGADLIDQYRLAAEYVDRILKGEKPSDLPVQAPTKYELVINLKTAKALALTIPPTLLARADEVIE
jgi:putative ABC transport system substrate-binding protein